MVKYVNVKFRYNKAKKFQSFQSLVPPAYFSKKNAISPVSIQNPSIPDTTLSIPLHINDYQWLEKSVSSKKWVEQLT